MPTEGGVLSSGKDHAVRHMVVDLSPSFRYPQC